MIGHDAVRGGPDHSVTLVIGSGRAGSGTGRRETTEQGTIQKRPPTLHEGRRAPSTKDGHGPVRACDLSRCAPP